MNNNYILRYQTNINEPYIDTHTLGLHYEKHYKTYKKNLDNILAKYNYHNKYPLELLSYHLDSFSNSVKEDILFNLGGVLNHIVYFESINKNGELPNLILGNKIKNTYGDITNLKEELKDNALKIKGSGYTFLVLDLSNNLKIINMNNQDSPYFYNLIPLLGIDMWEHAYYINYENKKDIYLDNILNILDFSFANRVINKLYKDKESNL